MGGDEFAQKLVNEELVAKIQLSTPFGEEPEEKLEAFYSPLVAEC